MDAFTLITIIIGIFIGSWLAVSLSDFLLLLYYHRIFTDEDKYLALYDHMDSETDYKRLEGHSNKLKDYADFLRLHAVVRPRAYQLLCKNLRAIKKLLITRYSCFILLPTLILWKRWYAFLLAVVVVQTLYLVYLRSMRHRTVAFYLMSMQVRVLLEAKQAKVT